MKDKKQVTGSLQRAPVMCHTTNCDKFGYQFKSIYTDKISESGGKNFSNLFAFDVYLYYTILVVSSKG